MEKEKAFINSLLLKAGITVGGTEPYDIDIINDNFYRKISSRGSLGLGESFVDCDWTCSHADQFIDRILRADVEKEVRKHWQTILYAIFSKVVNFQPPTWARSYIRRHYDIGDDIYRAMLDPRMIYTCGYWKDATTLAEAQEAKMHLVCRKMHVQAGMHMLDIGCGWGGFAKFAAQHYDVRVTGITNSDNQFKLATESCKGLPVTIINGDYRRIRGTYDRIISLGMFEHVGPKNYRTYMKTVDRCLKDDGLFLLHTIGGNSSTTVTDPWVEKNIFPGSVIPSIKQVGEATEKMFVMEDWHNFGTDYDKTLMAWYENFVHNWPELKKTAGYTDRFYRMWTYYLLMCAGSFRARHNNLWQIVFSKKGAPQYISVR